MSNIRLIMVVLILPFHVEGATILLNKPSVLSSTYSIVYNSSFANDGSRTGDESCTNIQQGSYWQGDLQGFYNVITINVSSSSGYKSNHLRNATVGVSANDVNCTEGEVINCGQWPNSEYLDGHTITFNCTLTFPVRFVIIQRSEYAYLCVVEVEVEGEPSIPPGANFETVMLNKVTTPTTSLSVTSVTGCGIMCHKTQPCVAFSYSSTQLPNCLLATDVTMTTDIEWKSYTVKTRFELPTTCQNLP